MAHILGGLAETKAVAISIETSIFRMCHVRQFLLELSVPSECQFALCALNQNHLKVVIGCAKCWYNVHRWTNVLAHIFYEILHNFYAGTFAPNENNTCIASTQAMSVSLYGTVMDPV